MPRILRDKKWKRQKLLNFKILKLKNSIKILFIYSTNYHLFILLIFIVYIISMFNYIIIMTSIACI